MQKQTVGLSFRSIKKTCIISILALVCIPIQSLQAAGFNVAPLGLNFTARQTNAQLDFTSLTNESTSIQLKLYTWSQKDGVDVLEPTKDILFAPPIVTIGGRDKQTIRFRLKRAAAKSQERSYRLFAEELPTADTAGSNFRLRFSLPIFVASIDPENPTYEVDHYKTDAGVKLKLLNTGNRHLKVTTVSVLPANLTAEEATDDDIMGSVTQSITKNSYALSGATQEWLIPLSTEQLQEDLQLVLFTDYYNNTNDGDIKQDGKLWLPVNENPQD